MVNMYKIDNWILIIFFPLEPPIFVRDVMDGYEDSPRIEEVI